MRVLTSAFCAAWLLALFIGSTAQAEPSDLYDYSNPKPSLEIPRPPPPPDPPQPPPPAPIPPLPPPPPQSPPQLKGSVNFNVSRGDGIEDMSVEYLPSLEPFLHNVETHRKSMYYLQGDLAYDGVAEALERVRQTGIAKFEGRATRAELDMAWYRFFKAWGDADLGYTSRTFVRGTSGNPNIALMFLQGVTEGFKMGLGFRPAMLARDQIAKNTEPIGFYNTTCVRTRSTFLNAAAVHAAMMCGRQLPSETWKDPTEALDNGRRIGELLGVSLSAAGFLGAAGAAGNAARTGAQAETTAANAALVARASAAPATPLLQGEIHIFHTRADPGLLRKVYEEFDPSRIERDLETLVSAIPGPGKIGQVIEQLKVNRFGPAHHGGESPQTAMSEMLKYTPGAKLPGMIRYTLDTTAGRVLDLTSPAIQRQWNYLVSHSGSKGVADIVNDHGVTYQIGLEARRLGYDIIKYPSQAAEGGTSYAVLSNFSRLLKDATLIH